MISIVAVVAIVATAAATGPQEIRRKGGPPSLADRVLEIPVVPKLRLAASDAGLLGHGWAPAPELRGHHYSEEELARHVHPVHGGWPFTPLAYTQTNQTACTDTPGWVDLLGHECKTYSYVADDGRVPCSDNKNPSTLIISFFTNPRDLERGPPSTTVATVGKEQTKARRIISTWATTHRF
jgi:hypothetical protein